jgi:hypothetical protein
MEATPGPSDQRQRARNRWFVAYTLLHNLSLVALRSVSHSVPFSYYRHNRNHNRGVDGLRYSLSQVLAFPITEEVVQKQPVDITMSPLPPSSTLCLPDQLEEESPL